MNETIYFLAELYNKIAKGIATDDEKAMYDSRIAISCIQEDVLIKAIRDKAREIELNN